MATPKRLFIPRKDSKAAGSHQADYQTDMRAIEIFNPINQLVAGSGITLDPSNGQGPQVEISASGGSGATPGYGYMVAMMDSNDYPFPMFIGPTNPGVQGATQLGPLYGTYPTGTPSTAEKYTFAASWLAFVNGGDSVNILPVFTMPSYTNGALSPITANFYYGAMTLDGMFTNYAQYTGSVNITYGGGTVQTTVGDLTPITAAQGDLSLVAGAGFTGNGLVSSAGAILYIASVTGELSIPSGTTFP